MENILHCLTILFGTIERWEASAATAAAILLQSAILYTEKIAPAFQKMGSNSKIFGNLFSSMGAAI